MSNQSSLDVQVGGSHYKNLGIQPVQYMHANKMGYIEGAIVKYITRFRDKGGKEDLLKIKHFVDLLIDLEYPDQKGFVVDFGADKNRAMLMAEMARLINLHPEYKTNETLVRINKDLSEEIEDLNNSSEETSDNV